MIGANVPPSTSALPLRVLIADPRAVMCGGQSQLLSAFGEVDVVGEVNDMDTLRSTVQQVQPDAILAGIALLAPLWLDRWASWKVVRLPSPLLVVMPEAHDAYLAIAAWAGAEGYVLENANRIELVSALRQAAARQGVWSSDDHQRALRWLEEVDRPWRSLTDREREVFHLLVRGMGNSAVADALSLASKTVEHHVCRILDKLGLTSRAMVAPWYYEQFPAILRGGEPGKNWPS